MYYKPSIEQNGKKRKGFTLIELLVVISIIGILATVGIASFSKAQKSARDGKRKTELTQIASALEMYRADNGKYPIGSAGSDRSCWINNENYSACHPLGALKQGNYLSVVPIDPGLNTYTGSGGCGGAQFYSYSSDGNTYKLSGVEETKGSSGCKTECVFGWGQYQYCVFNP